MHLELASFDQLKIYIEDHLKLQLPKVPDYFPSEARFAAEQYLREYVAAAFRDGQERYKNGVASGTAAESGLTEAAYVKGALLNFRVGGWLLPESDDAGDVGENFYSIGKNINIGSSHIGSCLNFLCVDTATKQALTFHLYPLSNWEDDEVALKIAEGYMRAMKRVLTFNPSRYDVASSSGGEKMFKMTKDYDRRDHRILLQAFRNVFGTVPVSKWNTTQIRYNAEKNVVEDPETEVILPARGAVGDWVKV